MAVDPKIDELLARLANVKSLPAPSQPFRTAEAAAGSRVRDAAGRAFASTPRLGDAIQGIQQGGSAQTGWQGAVGKAIGSPVGRAVLGGLNVIDMPRRAVISTVKEVSDALDTDPNTKSSFKDFRQQFNDPTFGFGRVAPGKGWGGRIVGFIGDVALDPLTYLTLGGTVPLKAVASGSRAAQAAGLTLRAGARIGAEEASLRAALGTKNVTGREGRFALANLVKQYGGTADEVKKVASHGKSAVPKEIAKVMGLQRNGLYMFGSRVRIPFSGPIGGALETALVKTRLGITNTNIGKKLQYLYTPKGATARLGDVSEIRADMASGRVSPETVDLIMTQLNGVENARRLGASTAADTGNAARVVANSEEVKQFRKEVASFIENGNEEFLSTSQINAKRAVQGWLSGAADRIDELMQRVDPSWTMPRLDNYVPHVLSDNARRWMEANLDNAWVRRLEQYMTSDVMDLKNNMAGRYLKPGVDFLESGKIIQTGSISEINSLFKEVTGKNFDLFETDIQRIMGKYIDTVRSAAEISSLLSDLKNADFVRLLRTQGEIDPEYLIALRGMVQGQFDEAGKINQKLRSTASSIVDEVNRQFSRDSRSSAASKLAATITDIRGEITSATRQIANADKAEELLDGLLKQVDDLIAKEQSLVASLASSFEDKSVVFELMKSSYDRTVLAARDLSGQVLEMRRRLADVNLEASDLQAFHDELKSKAIAAKQAFDDAEKVNEFYKEYGDSVAPVLQDVYERIRSAAFDGDVELEDAVHIGDEFWKGKRGEEVNKIIEVLMKPFDVDLYPSSASLGEDWSRVSLSANDDAGRLLRSIPDIGGAGTKAQRSSFGRKGSRRRMDMNLARTAISRSSWVGDNPEDVSDAFYFLSLRELRAAYDAAGGGEAGLAAQNAVARELTAGETSRSKLWLEARDAANRVTQAKKQLDVIGSKREQIGGNYSTSALEEIERLDAQLETASRISNDDVANSFSTFSANFDSLSGSFNRENLESFLTSASSLLERMRAEKPSMITSQDWAGFDRMLQRFATKIGNGEEVTLAQSKKYFDELESFVGVEFGNTSEVRRITRRRKQLQKYASQSMKIDKQFNDGVTTLADSVVDSGMKLSNYLMWHTARIAGDAIRKLGPSGMEIGETMWNYALSGAARQQLQSTLDFKQTRMMAERAMRTVQEKVYSQKPADRARALRDAMNELSPEEYSAVSATIGNVAFVERGKLASRRMPFWRRSNSKYVSVRDEILNKRFPGWDDSSDRLVGGAGGVGKGAKRGGTPYRFEGDVRGQRGITSDVEAAVIRAEQEGTSIEEMAQGFTAPKFTDTEDTLPDIDLLRGKNYSGVGVPNVRIRSGWESQADIIARQQGNDVRRKLSDSTPQALNKYVDELLESNIIDKETAESLKERVSIAEEFADLDRKTALASVDEEILEAEKRSLGREVRGAERAESEAFGLSGAFSKAIKTRFDGGTQSNTRIDEFFTYVFGDGKVRLGTGDSSSGAPVRSGLSPAEQEHARRVKLLFAKERVQKTLRRRQGMASVENELKFWSNIANSVENSKTGITQVVDYARAERIVLDKQSARTTIADLKKVLKGQEAEETVGKINLIDGPESTRRRIKVLENKIKSLDAELSEMETQAGQLIPLGSASTNAYRTITVADSQFGKLDSRLDRRIEALRSLSIDPTAGETISDLSTGIGKKRNMALGRFSYLEFLKSHLNELDAAVDSYKSAETAVRKVDTKLSRAAKAKQQDIAIADAIRNNPALDERVNQVLNGSGDLVYPKEARWLDASRLGQTYDKAGRPQRTIPEPVASLVNQARNVRIKMERIERNPMYTRSLQRKQENDFFKLLAKINLDNAALDFPDSAFTEEMMGDLRRFASSSPDGLNANSMALNRVREVSFSDVADKLMDVNQKKYTVVVDGRVANSQAVVDAIRFRSNATFSYTMDIERIEDAVGDGLKNRAVFTDANTGKRWVMAGEPDLSGSYPRDVALDRPVYADTLSFSEAEDFGILVSPSGRVTVYENGGRVTGGKNANNLFVPRDTIVSFEDTKGNTRVYRMDTLSIEQNVSNALDPAVVFDAAQGRGLTKNNFEGLFQEPVQPGSAAARKMRAQIDDAVAMRDGLFAKYNDYRAKMRSATTEKSRRNYQGLAAGVEEDMREVEQLILGLEERYRGSLPANHMAAVQAATQVLEYFKQPTVHMQLGLKVDKYPIGIDAATGRINYTFAEISDKQAISAFETYVEALEFKKLKRYRSADVDVAEPMVSKSVFDKRKDFLNKKLRKSPEGALLRQYNGLKTEDAAIRLKLRQMRNGGSGEELLASREAAIRERDRLLGELDIAEHNVRKALRSSDPAMKASAFEDVGGAAGVRLRRLETKRMVKEREDVLASALSADILNTIPADVRAAAAEELKTAGRSAVMRNVFVDEAKTALESTQALETVLKKELDVLVKEESRLNATLAGMIKIRMGEGVERRLNKVIPPEYKEMQLRLNGNSRYGVKGIKQEIADKQAQLADIANKRRSLEAEVIQTRSAVDTKFTANLSKQEAEGRLTLVRDTLQDMKDVRSRAKKPKDVKPVKKTKKKELKAETWVAKRPEDANWTAEFDDFVSEVDDLIQRVSAMEDGPATGRLASLITEYVEGKAALLRKTAIAGEGEAQIPAMLAMGPQIYKKVLDDGWVKLTGAGSLSNFNNLQMRPEVQEILTNMNRLTNPAIVAELNRFTGRYTKFFKAWALATPGYHTRNSLTNAFMMFAAGGRPKFLYEGMLEYNALHKALIEGTPFETYAMSLPLERQALVRRAYDAMLGSGVGQTAEIGFDSAGVLTNNAWTRLNRRVGIWTESHSRFMLAYDGIRQGLDVNGATARVRKFLFDYEDISTLDQYMRSIIPFWMWSSRILPLTIQNIYMNPRPYQFYNSLRRNMEDREKTEGLPAYLRQAGAFGLPGTSLAATPDLGFNRMQADVAAFTDPIRLASNVNPALRVPVELLAGKSFFRNRDFAESPVEVSGPVGRLASLLGTPVGKGTMQGGKQFVDEDLLYALTNTLPLLNTAERFIPSQEYYQQRGTTNPFLGFVGAPVRQITPEMRTSEQRRRLAEIRELLRNQPKPEGE